MSAEVPALADFLNYICSSVTPHLLIGRAGDRGLVVQGAVDDKRVDTNCGWSECFCLGCNCVQLTDFGPLWSDFGLHPAAPASMGV